MSTRRSFSWESEWDSGGAKRVVGPRDRQLQGLLPRHAVQLLRGSRLQFLANRFHRHRLERRPEQRNRAALSCSSRRTSSDRVRFTVWARTTSTRPRSMARTPVTTFLWLTVRTITSPVKTRDCISSWCPTIRPAPTIDPAQDPDLWPNAPRLNPGGPGPFGGEVSVWNESTGIFRAPDLGHQRSAGPWIVGARWTEDDREFHNFEFASTGCDISLDPRNMCAYTLPVDNARGRRQLAFSTRTPTRSRKFTPMLSLTRNLASGAGMVYCPLFRGLPDRWLQHRGQRQSCRPAGRTLRYGPEHVVQLRDRLTRVSSWMAMCNSLTDCVLHGLHGPAEVI